MGLNYNQGNQGNNTCCLCYSWSAHAFIHNIIIDRPKPINNYVIIIMLLITPTPKWWKSGNAELYFSIITHLVYTLFRVNNKG